MAIVPAIPGLVVTVQVAGEALPEYDYDEANAGNDAQNVASKYIEVPLGSEFEVRSLYQTPYNPASMVQVDIMLDGDYVQAPFVEWGGKDEFEGYKYGKAAFITEGQSETRSFRFAALVIEENEQPVTEGSRQQISPIGQIMLYFYYIEDLEEAELTLLPRRESGGSRPLNQKAVKATLTPGDFLACRTDLSMPELCDSFTVHQVKTAPEPFAKFTFYYRSTAALKSLGVIPRTPSPSPEPEPEPKEPEVMDAEELRAEVIRWRSEQQKLMRIKRERKESVTTMMGDSDSYVEWSHTQPTKRARRSPGEGDEVVKLDD